MSSCSVLMWLEWRKPKPWMLFLCGFRNYAALEIIIRPLFVAFSASSFVVLGRTELCFPLKVLTDNWFCWFQVSYCWSSLSTETQPDVLSSFVLLQMSRFCSLCLVFYDFVSFWWFCVSFLTFCVSFLQFCVSFLQFHFVFMILCLVFAILSCFCSFISCFYDFVSFLPFCVFVFTVLFLVCDFV